MLEKLKKSKAVLLNFGNVNVNVEMKLKLMQIDLLQEKQKVVVVLDVKCGIRNIGEKHGNWKGGKRIDNSGYIKIWNSKIQKYIFKHKLIMEQFLKRPIKKGETIHHINGIKTDNRLDNLELWSHNHPYGQRVKDKIKWCIEFLKEYSPETLKV